MKPNGMRNQMFMVGAALATLMLLSTLLLKPDASAAIASWMQAIGATLAILSAIWIATEQERQRKADDAAETRAFVQAIVTEIRAIWSAYEKKIQPLIRAATPEKPFHYLVPLDSDVFTVYTGSSSRVGKITDDELRHAIVSTYARAKGFVYTLQTFNALLHHFKQVDISYREPDRDARIAQEISVLAGVTIQLQESDSELHAQVAEVMGLAERWLNSTT